jgi:hypothetical protein
VLVGAAAPSTGGAHLAGQRSDAGGVQQAANHPAGGVQFLGKLRGTGLLLGARQQVAVKVDIPLRVSVAVKALLLAVDDREAATDAEPAGRLCWWRRYACTWRAGRPTAPGDPDR